MADQDDKSLDDDYKDVFTEKSFSSRDVEDVLPDINDGDDDAGIFANSPHREPSSKGASAALLGTVVLLAVVGVGAYFAFTSNQEAFDQIKQNLDMTETPAVDDSASPPEELAGVVAPVPQESAPAPQENAETSVVADSSKPTTDEIPQPDVVANVPDQSVASEPPIASEATPSVPPSPAPDAGLVSPPKTEGAIDAAALSVVAPEKRPESPSSSEEKAEPSPSAEGEVKPSDSKASASAKVEPISPTEGEEAKKEEDTLIISEPDSSGITTSASGESESSGVTAPAKKSETVYYDSPSGKTLKDIPPPRMDPKRGDGESIIIVTGADVTDSIQMHSLDSQVVAAGRALKLGRLDAALEMYDDLYRQNPRDSRILMGRAVTLQKLGNEESAISAYEELLRLDQDNPDAVVNLAGLIRKKYPAVALSKLLDLRQKYPDNAGIAAQIGVAYADSGNLQDAYKYLSMASGLKPNDPQHYYNMAVVAERAGELKKAISLYEKALEVDAVHGTGRGISRDKIYDRLARLRGN
jgi:Flp pilus assembly protein TadD